MGSGSSYGGLLHGAAAPDRRQNTSVWRVGEVIHRATLIEAAFLALFAQLLLILLWALMRGQAPTFVVPFYFGLDYHDFYAGVTDWAAGVDPYLRGRLYTPPSSLAYGWFLHSLAFRTAAFVFFALNSFLIIASLLLFAKHIQLGRRNTIALVLTAAIFYPTFFLLDRGNVDAVMLALLVLASSSRNIVTKGVLFGASAATKIYSGLLFVLLLRQRRWKVVAIALATLMLVQSPFRRAIPSFFRAVVGRSSQFRFAENISPASLFEFVFRTEHLPGAKLVFLIFWAITLAWVLRREVNDAQTSWVFYTPWMISLPALVFPYSGILTLPLLAQVARETETRAPNAADFKLLRGFVLLGTQSVAFTSLLAIHWAGIHLLNAIGTLFLMWAVCMRARRAGLPQPAADSCAEGGANLDGNCPQLPREQKLRRKIAEHSSI